MGYTLQSVESYLQSNKDIALTITSEILGSETSSQSFNGIIGGKNGRYEVNPSNFDSADEYFEEWIESHNKLFEEDSDCKYEKSVHRVHRLLENESLKEYIKMYLVRTWLRKHKNK